MNTLYYSAEYDTAMYLWQRFHIFDEMKRHNCNFMVLNPLNYFSVEKTDEDLILKIRSGKYDVFLTPNIGA